MKKSIAFSPVLVPRVLDDSKTITRRLLNPQPKFYEDGSLWYPRAPKHPMDTLTLPRKERRRRGLHYANEAHWRKGAAIDWNPYDTRLWVRERLEPDADRHVTYAADHRYTFNPEGLTVTWSWKLNVLGAIYCPRWASRAEVDVLSVRCERLQEISEEDAKAEGVAPLIGIGADQRLPGDLEAGRDRRQSTHPHVLAFAMLWDELSGKKADWRSNPWVWRIEFSRVGSKSRAA